MHRFRLFWIIFVLGLTVDQISKTLARSYLAGNDVISLLNGCLEFRYVENSEGFLGYLHFLPQEVRLQLLTTGVALLLIVLGYLLFRQNTLSLRQYIAGSLILTGGTGNLADRLLHSGGVIDFMVIGIGSFRTGIFNVGDVSILAGSFYLGCSLANFSRPFGTPISHT